MKLNWLSLAFVISLCSCANVPYSDEYTSTINYISNTYEACLKSINDAPAAQKECFPLLTNKKILIRIEKISTYPLKMVQGSAGLRKNIVWCYPNAKDMERIMQTPDLVKPGEKYWVSGRFSAFRTSAHVDIYTLNECQIETVGQ